MSNYVYIWLGLVILFALVEAFTLGLTSIWFAFGALTAMIAAALRFPLALQITVFALGSLILFFLTKPLIRKFSLLKNERTNSDRILGEIGYVTEEIHNIDAKGQIKTMGQIWSARSAGGETIPAGRTVKVLRIEGVKAYVTPVEEEKK